MATTPLSKLIGEIEYWLRLGTFLHEPLKESLLHVLHNKGNDQSYIGLPSDPAALYQELDQSHRVNLNRLPRGVLQKDQMIFPPGKIETNSSKFDVTLIVILIRNCLNLPVPINGWNDKYPPPHDQSIAANAIRAREWRNFHHHKDPKEIDKPLFETRWQEGVDIITSFGYNYDAQALKKACLDPVRSSMLESTMDALTNRQNYLQIEVKQNASLYRMRCSVIHSLLIFLDNRQSRTETELLKNAMVLKNVGPLINYINILKKELNELKCVVTHENIDKISNALAQLAQCSEAISSTVESVSILREKVHEHSDRLSSIEGKQMNQDNISAIVLPEVLTSISYAIGDQWQKLAQFLSIGTDLIKELHQSTPLTSAGRMMRCFESKHDLFKWRDLKFQLTRIERDSELNIIATLKKETLLTYGIEEAHLTLRKLYVDELLDWMKEQPIIGNSGRIFERIPREKAYVDLAMISGSEIDKEWMVPDRQFHLKQTHFEKTSINLEDIMKKDDQLVIARGIAGIGKSTTIDFFVLKWAEGKILTGLEDSPNIKFLFKLTCRELNIKKTFHSAEEIILYRYKSLFKAMTLEDLDDIASHVLIVLDGLDELRAVQGITNISSIKDNDDKLLVKSVMDLINVKADFLHGHVSLIAGRPEACFLAGSVYGSRFPLKVIEICGFNSTSVNIYIENYFQGDGGPELAEGVKNKIKESENLTVMASVPVYLWIICGLFKAEVSIESPKTITQLCSYACLVFLRNHLKSSLQVLGQELKKDYSNITLRELCEDEDILKLIIALADLSKSNLKDNKVIFSRSDLNVDGTNIKIEQTGFIVSHNYGDLRGVMFQFRHLFLQEYLTAVHMYLKSENIINDLKTGLLSSCLPIVAGLCGTELNDKDDIVKYLITNLRRMVLKIDLSTDTMIANRKADVANSIEDHLNKSLLQCINNDEAVLDNNISMLLAALFEYQRKLSLSTIKSFAEVKVHIVDISHHHDIRNVIHIVQKLKLKDIYKISISNSRNDRLPDNIEELFPLFFSDKGYVKVLRIHGGKEMRIDAATDETDCQKSLTISLVSEKNNKDDTKHEKLLLSAFSVADKFLLYFSTFYGINSKYKSQLELCSKSITKIIQEHPEKELKQITLNGAYNKPVIALESCLPLVQKLDLVGSFLSPFSFRLISNSKCGAIGDSQHSRIKQIYIRNCKLTDEHFKNLQPIISNLSELDISFNGQLSPKAMQMLSSCATINRIFCLKDLCVSHCNLTDDHMNALAPTISCLEWLDISGNRILSPRAMTAISDAVTKTDCLKVLKLKTCDLRDDHIRCLKAIIPCLERLDISENRRLSPKAMMVISKAYKEKISKNTKCSLNTLVMKNCNITDDHIKNLKPVLFYLETLNLSRNEWITPQSMSYIAQLYSSSFKDGGKCNLSSLDLSLCKITDDHINHLRNAIKCLRKLDISSGYITASTVQIITHEIKEHVIQGNACLMEKVDLSQTRIQRKDTEPLEVYVADLGDTTELQPDNISLMVQVLNQIDTTVSS